MNPHALRHRLLRPACLPFHHTPDLSLMLIEISMMWRRSRPPLCPYNKTSSFKNTQKNQAYLLMWGLKMKIVGIAIKQLRGLAQMLKSRFKSILAGTILGSIAGILMLTCYSLGFLDHRSNLGTPHLPVTSFVQLMVTGDYIVKASDCDDQMMCEQELTPMNISSASGVKVSKGRILTAGHFCERFREVSSAVGLIDSDGDLLEDAQFVAIDHTGMTHNLEILLVMPNIDLCVARSRTVSGVEAKLSRRPPFKTERVWNIAAPQGIYFPNAPILLEGFYNGKTSRLGAHYTLRTAPGSSGSPIFRSDGTLAGIVHSVHPSFSMSTYAVELEDLKKALQATE